MQVLALQPDLVAQTHAQIARFDQWSFLYNLIDLGGEDEAEVVGVRVVHAVERKRKENHDQESESRYRNYRLSCSESVDRGLE